MGNYTPLGYESTSLTKLLPLFYSFAILLCCRICFVFDKIMIITRKVFEQYYFERGLILDKYNLGTAAAVDPVLKGRKSIISTALQDMLTKVSFLD